MGPNAFVMSAAFAASFVIVKVLIQDPDAELTQLMRGVYPGSFNPPTLGHIAIAEAAIRTFDLVSLDLVMSVRPLGKDAVVRPSLEDRLAVLKSSVADLQAADVVASDKRLIADIAAGYDVVVMGADKWAQVNDVAFYDDEAARDAALERLPTLAIASRGPVPIPPQSKLVLAASYDHVSSSAARDGNHSFMTPAAKAFDRDTGAWSDATRYDAYLAGKRQR